LRVRADSITPSWTDPDFDGGAVYYEVSVVDVAGNESPPASPETVSSSPPPVTADVFRLHPNLPSPFNSVTNIHSDVVRGEAELSLQIFDVSGRLVKTLLDGPIAEGPGKLSWDGRDDAGSPELGDGVPRWN